MRAISARQASQAFSRLLQEAEAGESVIIITRRGKPVAVLGPYPARSAEREQAIERAVELMRKGVPLGGRRFTRDEMHEH